MRIALDAMGGDHAPEQIVRGALMAAPKLRHEVLLVGDPDKIRPHLAEACPSNIGIHPATENIEMHEKPLDAIRRKKDSSLVVAANLVKSREAQCVVSAGNTGACTAACLLAWRQIHGFHRPAIASLIPGIDRHFLLLDAGASPDVDPEHLVEFALMGRAYAKSMMGRASPSVHLMNIGEEEGKGNAFSKQSYALLSKYPWFRGNIEGKELFRSGCDVVVCDAFVGNIVLKTAEGVAEFFVEAIRREVPKNPALRLMYAPLKRLMRRLAKRMDYAEVGGSPLLGLNGNCIICHGRSNAKAIFNALLQAQAAVELDLVGQIRDSILEELKG